MVFKIACVSLFCALAVPAKASIAFFPLSKAVSAIADHDCFTTPAPFLRASTAPLNEPAVTTPYSVEPTLISWTIDSREITNNVFNTPAAVTTTPANAFMPMLTIDTPLSKPTAEFVVSTNNPIKLDTAGITALTS